MVDAVVGNDYSFCLCAHLAQVGLDVTLVVTEDREVKAPVHFPLRKWAPSKNQDFSRFGKFIKYFFYLARLLWHIKKQRADVVHFQFFRLPRIESLYFYLLRALGTNVVYTVHDVWPHEQRRIDHFLNQIVYRSAKALVVHSQYIKNMLVRHFNINEEQIRVIPHGNFDHYLPKAPLTRRQARSFLNLNGKDVVLLFFGFIRKYKGLDYLIEAFEMVAARNPHLKLVVAGLPLDNELKHFYEKLISKSSARGQILYHSGFIPSEDIPKYFVAADIVVLPYRHIYHSGVLHLAYSFGRPVIATRVGDFEEMVQHRKTGFLIERDDTEQLAEVILEAQSHSGSIANMGRCARQLSETEYSWTHIADETKSAYSKVLNISSPNSDGKIKH